MAKLRPIEEYSEAEITALSERDKAQLESETRHRMETVLKDRDAEIRYNQEAILKDMPDKDLAEIEKSRPEEVMDIQAGKLPRSLKKEEFNPAMSMWTRFKLSNLGGLYDERTKLKIWGAEMGSEGTDSAYAKVKEQFKDEFYVARDEGRLWLRAKKPSKDGTSKFWYPLDQDPTSNIPKAFALFGAPVAGGTLGGMLLGGPSGAVSGAITGAVAGTYMVADELAKIDWGEEYKNIKNFLRDMPSDVTDAVWETFVAAPIETAAGVKGALAGVPAGIPAVTAALGSSVAAGLVEGARQAIGDKLGYKQKLSMQDILTNGIMGGASTYLIGAGPTTKLIANRLAPLVDKMAKKEIPQLRVLGTTNFPTEQEKQAIMELAPFADNFQEAGEKIISSYGKELQEQTSKKMTGLLPAMYGSMRRGMVAGAGRLSSVPGEAYLNYFRNPKRMLELDNNSGKFAGDTGRDLRAFAKERTDKTGEEWGNFLKQFDDKRVDVSSTTESLKNRVAELNEKFKTQGLIGEEKSELDMLNKIHEDLFIRTKPDGTKYARESMLTPYEAKDFKNEMGKYAKWDVADLSDIADPLAQRKIREARKIYFNTNKVIEDAMPDDELKAEAIKLRKKNENAHLQEDFMKAIFSEDTNSGNLLFDQKSYNILSNPTSKANVVLTDYIKNVDNSLGLRGSDSYLQKMNDLYSHSYLGSPGSGGYSRWNEATSGAGTFGSIASAATKTAGIPGQYGYGVGRVAGLRLVEPKTLLTYMGNAKSTESFISDILQMTGKGKSILGGYVPIAQTEVQAITNLLQPIAEEKANPWTSMQRPELDLSGQQNLPSVSAEGPSVANNPVPNNNEYLNQLTY